MTKKLNSENDIEKIEYQLMELNKTSSKLVKALETQNEILLTIRDDKDTIDYIGIERLKDTIVKERLSKFIFAFISLVLFIIAVFT